MAYNLFGKGWLEMYLEIKGKRALFSRHEFKAERISYEVPTPSSMIGVLKSIYWKPQMDYEINEIHVINEPEFELIMKNGQSMAADYDLLKKSFDKGIDVSRPRGNDSTPMSENVLVNVHYVVRFHIITSGIDDSVPQKHQAIFLRRAESGQCFRQPCLGVSEFPCEFNMIRKEDIPKSKIKGERRLGIMLHHIDYSGNIPEPVFYRPIMRDGIIDVSENSDSKDGWLFEELCNFYDNNQINCGLPTFGYSNEKIMYKAVISRSSEMISLEPMQMNGKGKAVPTMMNVPEAVKGRTSGIKACFAYDNASYVFGIDDKNGEKKRLAFIKKIKEIIKSPLPETDILVNFLQSFSIGRYSEIFDQYRNKNGMIDIPGNIVFQIEGEDFFVHEIEKVQHQWAAYYEDTLPNSIGICGVSGKKEKLTTMHSVIKGVAGANAFTKLIAVNSSCTTFNSYGWEGLSNSNMGVIATHKYTVSLNWLLSQPDHRVSVGNSTFVFWTNQNETSALNCIKYMLLGFNEDEEPEKIRNLEAEETLYVLELKANSSRLIVGGFRKFRMSEIDSIINFCLKASGAVENGKIKRYWDYILEQKGDSGVNESRIGYKLGELFAILEKAQRDAVKSTRGTRTIVDKYAQKAHLAPYLVFPKLLENSIHHTNKVDYGIRQKITEKLAELERFESPFPKKLSQDEQCFFHMGYFKMNSMLYEEIKTKSGKKKKIKEGQDEQD